jgi:dihydropteroate synthase
MLPTRVSPEARVYLRPIDLATDRGVRVLAGGWLRFARCEVRLRGEPPVIADLPEIESWAREIGPPLAFQVAQTLLRLSAPRPAFAGLAMDRPRLMGIVNVTPDSFSDGGQHATSDAAAAHAERLMAEGADIIDVGGESTRPGSAAITPEIERDRIMPVLRRLQRLGVPRSIDTRNALVMSAATRLGASVINDVTALAHDPDALAVAASSGCAVVLMHSRGTPDTMQSLAQYDDVLLDVYDALENRVAACLAAGIKRERIAVDPGIGFAKTAAQCLALTDGLALFHGLGVPVLYGASRKSFIPAIAGDAPADRRLGGSLAAALAAVARGAQMLRVHDVAETVQAVAIWQRLHVGLGAGLSGAAAKE